MQLCMGNAERAHKKISLKTGRGLGHVTHTIFGSTVSYPSDSLASCFVSLLVVITGLLVVVGIVITVDVTVRTQHLS